jgi:hypothetical protein
MLDFSLASRHAYFDSMKGVDVKYREGRIKSSEGADQSEPNHSRASLVLGVEH